MVTIRPKPGDILNMHLEIDDATEHAKIRKHLTRKKKGAHFKRGQQRFKANTERCFMKGNTVPIGLWKEVYEACNKHNIPLEFSHEFKNMFGTKEEEREYKSYMRELVEKNELPFPPHDYQLRGAWRAFRNRFCILDYSMAAGKTYTMYLLCHWLDYHYGGLGGHDGMQVLVIVPDGNLADQAKKEFTEVYGNAFNVASVHGSNSLKSIDGYDVVFGSFRTLNNRDEAFFKRVGFILIDEIQKNKEVFTTNVVKKCKNARMRVGLSGTVKDKGDESYYKMLMLTGPVVDRITPKELQDRGQIPPINVNVIRLAYDPTLYGHDLALSHQNPDIERSDVYQQELRLVRSNTIRVKAIKNYYKKFTDQNCLLLFTGVESGYGRKIQLDLKHSGHFKDVFYVDGEVSKDDRKFYMNVMEQESGYVLVASFGTFSTGMSIKRLHRIGFIETVKDYERVLQGIGRAMRTHETKNSIELDDFVDEFIYSTPWGYEYTSYGLKHSKTRKKHYRDEKNQFPIKEYLVRMPNPKRR